MYLQSTHYDYHLPLFSDALDPPDHEVFINIFSFLNDFFWGKKGCVIISKNPVAFALAFVFCILFETEICF